MTKSYGLKSPKKSTKECMNTVEDLYNSFARVLAPYLTRLLQSYYEIRTNRIVEKRYQEFTNSVQDHSLPGVITLSPANKNYNEASLTMEVDTRLALFMIERLLGGAGTEYGPTRDFTDIERAVLQYALGKLTKFTGETWAQYLGIDATLTGLQTNPHLLQMSAQEDMMIQVEPEVIIDKLAARLSMVMLAPNVEELMSKFGYSSAASQKKQDDEKQKSKRQYIEQHILESEVEIRAIFHEFSLGAQDILQLTPGDVIPLSKKLDSKTSVYVGDVACFEAKVGHTRLRKAVEISSELQPGGTGTLDVDKDTIKELMEIEAVPVCDRLGSLLGRSVKMAVSKMEETDTGALAGCLSHSNVAIEGHRTVNGLMMDQLYVFSKDDTIRVVNYIMGMPVDNPSLLDEIVLSTLKEVVSQCISVAMNGPNDLLGRDMRVVTFRIAVFDNMERILETIRIWKTDQSLLLVRLHCLIDGMVESDAYIIVSQAIGQALGVPELEELELGELAESIQKPKETVVVQEVSLPELKYTPLKHDKEQAGDNRKKLLDIIPDVSARASSTACSVKDVLALKEGQVLVLDKQAGSPADVVVNGELIGKGDVLVTREHFGTCIIEIAGKRE